MKNKVKPFRYYPLINNIQHSLGYEIVMHFIIDNLTHYCLNLSYYF